MGANKDDSIENVSIVGSWDTENLSAARRSAKKEMGTQIPTNSKVEVVAIKEIKASTSHSTVIVVKKRATSRETVPSKRRAATTRVQMSLRKQRWSWYWEKPRNHHSQA